MLPSSTVENYLKAIHHGQSSLPKGQRLLPMGHGEGSIRKPVALDLEELPTASGRKDPRDGAAYQGRVRRNESLLKG